MSAGTKDTMKVLYLDVTFQGKAGGRLALRSRSMTYFSAFGERKANIAWDVIAEFETNLASSSSSSSSSSFETNEECMLKIINVDKKMLLFQMNNRKDLCAIQLDIESLIEAYRNGDVLYPDSNPNLNSKMAPGQENSLLTFPTFVKDTSRRMSAVQSIVSRSVSGSTITGPTGLPLEVTVDQGDEAPRNMVMAASAGTNGRDSVYAGDEVAPSQRSVCDASTIATTVIDGDDTMSNMDPETAMMKDVSLVEPKTFQDDASAYHTPIATYTIVPEQAMKPANKEAEAEAEEKKIWRSAWFWLAICLIVVLLLGMGIGIGIGSSKSSTTTTTNASTTTTTAAGLSEAQTSPPVASAFEVIATMEAPTSATPTSAPTLAPSKAAVEGCDGIAHSDAKNDRATAIDAGSFGGSSQCAVPFSSCQGTEWVPFRLDSGTTAAWFTGMALENSVCSAEVEHRVRLTVPSNVDYDLHVYRSGSDIPYGSSTSGSGVDEEVVISLSDNAFAFDYLEYYILVESRSGSSCRPWTLEISGHQCDF